MKKPSNSDLSIMVIIAFFSAGIAWSISAMYYYNKTAVTIENPINEALKKRGDSLEAVVHFRDSLDRLEEKKQMASDSVLISSNKILKGHYEEFKGLDLDARINKYDSILANYNKVRR